MSSNRRDGGDARTAEERAEDVMQRVVKDGSRVLGRVFGRVREEVEDIVAEGRSMHERSRKPSRR